VVSLGSSQEPPMRRIFLSVWVGEVCWGLLKATLSLCILHTLFSVVNIVVSFFFFKKNANINCTLSVPF